MNVAVQGSKLFTGQRAYYFQARGLPNAWHPRQAPLLQRHCKGVLPTQTKAYNTPQRTQQPTWNPVEVVKREQGLQSNKLPTELREKVSSAVEELRFRVTVGDVAARAGVKLQDADDTLKALAYDSQATLEVSEQGDVVYTFPRDFQSSIAARSVLLSAQPFLKGAANVAQYLVRVAFGTALLSSIAIVWFAITVLLSSRDNRDDRQNRGGYYNGYSSYNDGGMGARVFFNLTDLLIYLDPNYSRTSHERVARGAQLTFLEAIFSFVFGDGDPNAEFDDQRWAALGQMIQERGGVVTAEEMAPYLDPPAGQAQGQQGTYVDESYVLPALIRFGGEPIVDEATGTLVYRFPGLQASGVTLERVRGASTISEVPQEKTWELTAASMGQVLGVVALGAFNVAGVLTLSGLLTDPQARYMLTYQGLGWVGAILPALQVYAATFFGIPALRSLFNMQRNMQIVDRNDRRIQAAELLDSGARWLREKLSAARREGRNRFVRKSDVVFTTDKETGQQLNERDTDDWDQRLRKSSSPRQGLPPPTAQPAPQRVRRQARDFDGGWQ